MRPYRCSSSCRTDVESWGDLVDKPVQLTVPGLQPGNYELIVLYFDLRNPLIETFPGDPPLEAASYRIMLAPGMR